MVCQPHPTRVQCFSAVCTLESTQEFYFLEVPPGESTLPWGWRASDPADACYPCTVDHENTMPPSLPSLAFLAQILGHEERPQAGSSPEWLLKIFANCILHPMIAVYGPRIFVTFLLLFPQIYSHPSSNKVQIHDIRSWNNGRTT